MADKKSTIFDVAEAAGVSIKTVSRVFNREPNVRQSTAERVMAAARKLSYSPNLSAKRLASQRSFLVGLVYDTPTGDNSFVPDIQSGALATCKDRPYELIIHPTDADNEDIVEQLIEFYRRLDMDGLILLPPLSDNRDLLSELAATSIRFSRISQSFTEEFGPCVSVDDEDAAFAVTEYLIELGHDRIGFICGKPSHGATRERLQGYQRALNKHRVAYRKTLVKDGDFSFASGREAGRDLLQRKHRPTAIFASNDDMASGVLVAARELNLRVPEDLSICGYDDIAVAQQCWPPLTTVRQPIREMARIASELLVQTIEGKKPKHHVLLNAKLIIRESSAAPGAGTGTGIRPDSVEQYNQRAGASTQQSA